MDVLCGRWGCKGCWQIFTRNEDLTRHLKEERRTGGKTKIICSGGKHKHTLNSSEKVFYGGDSKFSYTVCQWIEAQAVETGKHIHHKMCEHGGERMVKVWVLNTKGEKNWHLFWLMNMNLKSTQCIVSWMSLARAYIFKG